MRLEEFWDWVEVGAEDQCWPWRRSVTPKGYGQAYLDGGQKRAHRVAYRLRHGFIPPGLHVCHSCDNPRCCNPAHLWVGTNADNMRDKARKGRVGAVGRRFGPTARMMYAGVVVPRLRAKGLTYSEIGRRLGISVCSAWKQATR
jgi:hypothetical protein